MDLLLGHLSHWYWQLLAAGPFLVGGVILLIAQLRAGSNPELYSADAEREQADRELDDILGS